MLIKSMENIMDICHECGEDLKLNSDHFLSCDNGDCEKSKPNQFDPIGHIEKQNLVNDQMDNT
jgi:hypothetical protein